MTLEELTKRVADVIGEGSGLDKKIKFDFGDVGKMFIDGANNSVTNEDGAADATITVKLDDFIAMGKGQLDPMMAFMQGKMKVAGDMMLAQKLIPILKKLG